MMRSLLLWVSRNRRLGEVLSARPFTQRAVRRFMPGETRGEAVEAGQRLVEEGFGIVYTLLGENVPSEDDVDDVVREYLGLLDEIARRNQDAHLAVKLTQLGLGLGEDEAQRSLSRILEAATKRGVLVWIDMEDSSLRAATLRIYREAVAGFGAGSIGICLQAYLRVTPEDLESLIPAGPSVRIVKGAYAESPDVAFPRRADVDRAFFSLATRVHEAGGRLGFATHDGRLVQAFQNWLQGQGRDLGRHEFQLLFGIRTDLQRALLESGSPVRVLISYGPAWFPWYMRRLAERPANLWFVMKNLFRG